MFEIVIVKMNKDTLKTFIRATLIENQISKKPGAGIILVKKFNDTWKVLTLVLNGVYDIPKGGIENGESTFETAIRETHEESNIQDFKFQWGKTPFSSGRLTVYLASTTEDGKIIPNPKTGIYEHDEARWVDWDEMIAKTSDFIRPCIRWARREVNKSQIAHENGNSRFINR